MKWRTLQPTTSVQVAEVSHVLGSMQRVGHKLEVCASREIRLLQDLSPIEYWNGGSTVDWYFGIGQGS